MFTMVKRNIRLYFRDKSTVLFSLMAVWVIIILNIFFLTNTMRSSFDGVDNIEVIIGTWLMAGIISVTSVTSSLGAMGTMMADREKKIYKDFYTSPLKRSALAGGYMISSAIVGIIMSIFAFVCGEAYILYLGGSLPEIKVIIELLGLIVLSVLANSAFMFFLVSLFKTQSAFSAISTLVGTLIGFVMGIYMPIGSLPEKIQWIVKLFPSSYSASALRTVMLDEVLTETFKSVPENIPAGYEDIFTRNDFNLEMGVCFEFGDYTTNLTTAIIVMTAVTVVFYGLSIINVSRKSK